MTFIQNASQLTLTGHSYPSPIPLTHDQLSHDLTTNSPAYAYSILYVPAQPHLITDTYLTIIPTDDSPTLLNHTNPDLHHLLHQFSEVFATPRGLPPPRPHDHHIHLLPNSQPVNIKPYRYPHRNKEVMITLISDMLRGYYTAKHKPIFLTRSSHQKERWLLVILCRLQGFKRHYC